MEVIMREARDQQVHWWHNLPVHPACAVFPALSETESDQLVADIRKNGVLTKITVLETAVGRILLDGRNRLAATNRAGVELTEDNFTVLGEANVDPVAFVISANVRRRHLTKAQQADLIVKVVEAARPADGTESAPSVIRVGKGRLAGKKKDHALTKAVEEGKKVGISESTMKKAHANRRAKAEAENGSKRKQPSTGKRGPRAVTASPQFEVESQTTSQSGGATTSRKEESARQKISATLRRLERNGYDVETIDKALAKATTRWRQSHFRREVSVPA
jgi:hypothetical protein